MDPCLWDVPRLPNSLSQSLERRARLVVRSTFLKHFQELPPIDRLYPAKLQIIEFLHIGVHHAGSREPAKITPTVRRRPVENPSGLVWIGGDSLRSFDIGALLRPPDVLPVEVAICRRISRRFHERFENDRRTADDVPQNPRNDDDQVLPRTGANRRLKPQARLRFLGQQVPALNSIPNSTSPVDALRRSTSGKVCACLTRLYEEYRSSGAQVLRIRFSVRTTCSSIVAPRTVFNVCRSVAMTPEMCVSVRKYIGRQAIASRRSR